MHDFHMFLAKHLRALHGQRREGVRFHRAKKGPLGLPSSLI